MNDTLRIRQGLATVLTMFACASLPASAAANELSSSAHASGFVIHDAAETLQNYCHVENGVLVFTVPGGASWELVTSTSDPAIANPGDGSFHPFDASEVRSALNGVRYPLGRVGAEVFILPYPRRAGLESAAGPGLVLLSPGVRKLPVQQQHSEFTHELGHVVQFALMPDADTTAWGQYRALRGIADGVTYSAAAPHADRPHEIFAEDFRALFGDADANYSGTIENPALAYPTNVGGLSSLVANLATAPAIASPLTLASSAGATPNVMFARSGAGAAPLDLFDVTGRRIATVLPDANANGCQWTWNGRDVSGARVAATVLFARARDGMGGIVKLVRLP